MSRVDEALRRSRGSGASEVTSAAFQIRPEHYPSEVIATDPGQPAADPLAEALHRRLERSGPRPLESRPAEDRRLVTRGADIDSTEQYSRLAAALHDAQLEQGMRSLIVTSAVPREGKTLTATNLALTLSGLYGRRVLLIDADLRRPSVHEVLSLPNRIGLGAMLRSDQVPVPIVDVTPKLAVIVAGPPHANPMQALATSRMKTIIDVAKTEFDWVIVDTPPIGLLPDANLIARYADGVILVIAAHVTHYRAVQDALATIGPERVVGTVLNKADRVDARTGQYSRYYQPA